MRQNINLNSLSEFLSVVITPRELADCLADVAMNYITTRDEEEDNMRQIKNDVAILQMLIQQLRAL